MLTITDDEFRKLTAFIKTNYGINLKEEKRTLLLGRLQNVLAQKKLGSFSEYYQQLLADSGAEVVTLIDRITTNHTYFMREADHFRYFKSTVLPDLVKTAKDKDLRIWSAGCSSGEEPYTLAMIIYDFLGKEIVWWDAKLLATDISSQMLEIAKAGVYSDEKLAKLPAQWRLNYFKKYDAQNSVLSDKIRNEVIYRKFNLINPVFPFKRKFQAIFCRNVMIYFDAKTKAELVKRFYEFTEPGGYLFVGHSESLTRDRFGYKYVMPAIYRKE